MPRCKKTRRGKQERFSIKINQFDANGNFIRQFSSLREAERITNINHGNISKCCSGKFAHTGGYIFKKDTDKTPTIGIDFLNGIRKPVIEIDECGNVLFEYSSLMEASRKTGIDNGNLSKVCNGKKRKIKNRIFKFKNEIMEKLITEEELNNIITNSTIQNKTIILKFEATWCKPCQVLDLIIEKVVIKNTNIEVVKINVDNNSELSKKYGIKSIPTVYIYKNGEEINKFTGIKNEEEILKLAE